MGVVPDSYAGIQQLHQLAAVINGNNHIRQKKIHNPVCKNDAYIADTTEAATEINIDRTLRVCKIDDDQQL